MSFVIADAWASVRMRESRSEDDDECQGAGRTGLAKRNIDMTTLILGRGACVNKRDWVHCLACDGRLEV